MSQFHTGNEEVENLACRRGVLSAEDRELRETIAAIDEVREDDIDLALVEAGLSVDVVTDDSDAASGIKQDLDSDDGQSACELCGIQWRNGRGRHDTEDMEEVT